MQTHERILAHFRRHGYDSRPEIYEQPDGTVTIGIDLGDWKHDHLFVQHLMSLLGYRKTGTQITYEDGSDYYGAEHTFVERLDYRRLSAGEHYGPLHDLTHRIKGSDPEALREAADILAPLLPPDAVIIPMPSHTGKPDGIAALCRLLGEMTGRPVCPCLVADGPRVSMCEAKKAVKDGRADRLPFPEELLMRKEGLLPPGTPAIVDNVIASGTTAVAALNAIGKDETFVFTLTDDIDCQKITKFFSYARQD